MRRGHASLQRLKYLKTTKNKDCSSCLQRFIVSAAQQEICNAGVMNVPVRLRIYCRAVHKHYNASVKVVPASLYGRNSTGKLPHKVILHQEYTKNILIHILSYSTWYYEQCMLPPLYCLKEPVEVTFYLSF